MRKNGTVDLTQGPILKQLIAFAIPVILTGVLQQLYTTADQIVVGKFAGEVALAAVGSTAHVTNLLLNLFTGLSVGATVTCAKFFGAKDFERVSRTVHTAFGLAVLSGLFISIVGYILASPIMIAMKTPDDVIAHSIKYMQIRFIGVPFSLVYNFGAGLLRASGDTKKPLLILSATGLVNVLLNLLFVIKYNMAEAGVGWATVISNAINCICVFAIFLSRNDEMKLVLKKIRLHKNELLNIIKIGVPSGLNTILFNFSNIFLQSSVNSFGKIYMAASTAASSLGNYLSLIVSSFGTAMVSFVGQNYGAKKYKRLHKSTFIATGVGVVITALIAVMIALNGRFFLGLFTDKAEVINAGIGKVFILCFGYILFVPASVYSASLRGVEKSNLPFIVNVVSTMGVRLLWIWFIFPLNRDFEFLFLCFPISWTAASISLTTAYFLQRRNFPKTEE